MPIIKEPHAVLRQQAHDIPISDIGSKKIQNLIVAMKETLKSTPDGVGLAAPQIGESVRIFIVSEEAEEIDRAQVIQRNHNDIPLAQIVQNEKPYQMREWCYYVFINPHAISKSRKKIDGTEGCLSVPGVFGTIKRHEKITMQGYDEYGKKFIRGKSRFFARVMQHELDHLNGTLFIDHATHLIKPS